MADVVTLPDNCIVRIDGDLFESNDFVAILSKPNGDAGIYYNTDALTLGMAMKMVAKEFVICLEQLAPSMQHEIEQILGDAFIRERLIGDGQDRG